MAFPTKLIKLFSYFCFLFLLNFNSAAAADVRAFGGLWKTPKLFSLSLKDYDIKSEADDDLIFGGIKETVVQESDQPEFNLLGGDVKEILIFDPSNKQPSSEDQQTPEAVKRPQNYFSIAELNQRNFAYGTYETEGYVVFIYRCDCPKGSFCKPCMQNNIIVSMNSQIKSSYSLADDQDIIIFAEDTRQFDLGRKYKFIIQILDVKSTFQKLNNLKLIYAKKQDF